MAIAIPSPLPDASATVSGKVSLTAQTLGSGPKVFGGEVTAPDIRLVPGSAPGTPTEGQVYYDSSTHTPKFRNATTWIDLGGGGGSAVWGGITGTLSSQTDLQSALNAKASLGGAAFTGEVSVPDVKFNPGSAPGTPTEGQCYYDSVAHVLRFRDATTWVDCGGVGSIPDCSGTVAGKVNLVAQVMGAGTKTFENIISPSTYNTNGTGASDVCVKLGTSTADGSVNSTAKLISLLTGIGGTPVEKLSVLKSGYLTTASALAMLSDSSAGVSASNGASLRANAGVLEISQNGGAYVAWSVALAVDTPQALTSSSNHIAISLSSGRNFYHTMTENTTLDAPTGVAAGMSGCIEFTQHGTAAKTLAYNTFWKFSGSIVPALSTTLSSKHLLAWYIGHDTSYATCRLIVAVG